MNDDIITGDKLSLRPITPDDTELIVRWRNNPRVRANFVYRDSFTVQTHEKWLRDMVDTGRVEQFIMSLRDGTPVGSVYLRRRDTEDGAGCAEYGIFIGEDSAVGLGLGGEAALLMVCYARERLCLDKLVLRVFADNAPAIASYEAAGFHTVRTLPDVICSDGSHGGDMLWMEVEL